MKKSIIILTLIMGLLGTQVYAATTTNTNKKPAQKTTATVKKGSTAVRTNNNQAYPTSGSDFLLKYNIDDLEAAPWLHEGKRVY